MAKYDFLKKDEKNKGSEAVKTSGKYDFIKPKPKPPTLGDKVKAVGKEVVKGIVSPVVTTVARPFQAAAALGGVSDEKINEFSKKISGGYIAPTPQNTSDVVKDVGRAAQTVLMGTTGATLKAGSKIGARLFPATAKTTAANLAKYKLAGETLALGAEGAGIGAGVALEQGGAETTAKDLLKSSAIGAVTGAVAPLAIKGAGRLFKGKAAPVVEEAVEKTAVSTPEVSTPKVNIPEGPTLLPERTQTPSKQGDNFTFTDTVDPAKVATIKARTDYETKLKAYNQNPTPNKLKGVLKAKDTLAKVEAAPISIPTKEVPTYNTNIPESKVTTSPSVVKMPNPNKGETISKASRDINKKLVDDGFNKLEPSEQAKFTSEERAKQVEDITTYMSDDIDNAIASAVSGKGIPKDIDEQILFNAVKNHASEIGDVDLQRALAKSPIASKRSILAQELGASATLNDPSDAVSIMSNLNKDIERSIEKKLGKPLTEARKEVLESIKTEVRKINRKQSFQEFINKNIC